MCLGSKNKFYRQPRQSIPISIFVFKSWGSHVLYDSCPPRWEKRAKQSAFWIFENFNFADVIFLLNANAYWAFEFGMALYLSLLSQRVLHNMNICNFMSSQLAFISVLRVCPCARAINVYIYQC